MHLRLGFLGSALIYLLGSLNLMGLFCQALQADTPATGAASPLDFAKLSSPILFRGDQITAYRDPAAIYHNGWFYVYFTLMKIEQDKQIFGYTAWSKSEDLVHWTEPGRCHSLWR
jgi:hypothetical protein